MKLTRFVPVVAAALAGVAFAQQSPSEVTDGEIAKYKKAAYNGCADPGIARGDPPAKVDAVCSCVMSSLEKSMKRAEWQQAYFYWLKEQEPQAKVLLGPHLRNLDHCRPAKSDGAEKK